MPEQTKDLTFRYREADAVHGPHVAVVLLEVFDLD
jgi:hypothetical protein